MAHILLTSLPSGSIPRVEIRKPRNDTSSDSSIDLASLMVMSFHQASLDNSKALLKSVFIVHIYQNAVLVDNKAFYVGKDMFHDSLEDG